eukprot:COSAG02_NODE_3061_length_7449_cov_5.258367_1_plen_75_part_00
MVPPLPALPDGEVLQNAAQRLEIQSGQKPPTLPPWQPEPAVEEDPEETAKLRSMLDAIRNSDPDEFATASGTVL